MTHSPQSLWAALHSRALVDGTGPDSRVAEPPAAPSTRPWYITALLGTSGWVAGLFTLGFIALLLRPSSAPAAALTGAVLLAAAWGLFTVERDREQASHAFVAQLALALSIAGQCLLLYASSGLSHGLAGVARSAVVLQVALALAMPNRLHRTLSTLFATIAWAVAWRFSLFGEPSFWHGGEGGISPSLSAALGGWMLAWLPVGVGLGLLIQREPRWMARGWQPALRPILTGLILGLAFATLASHPFESFRWFGSEAASEDWLALWPLLSALGALGALAAAFALGSHALMGACAVAVLLHVSHFYYALGTSLLLKSALMMTMGATLLLTARMLRNPAATKGQP